MVGSLSLGSGPRDFSIFDDKRLSCRNACNGRNPKGPGNFSLGVGNERERDLVFFFEFFLTSRGISADSQDREPIGCQPRKGIAKGTGLLRAARCVCLGIKINERQSLGINVIKVDGGIIFVRGGHRRSR